MCAETTEKSGGRKPEQPKRRMRGFLRAADLAPEALKSGGAKRGFAELRLLTEWRAVVGEFSPEFAAP